jgi:hypothetical protein
VLRFAIPAGSIIAAAAFAAYLMARAGGLPLTQQRTAATLVTLVLSLTVLTMLAMPLTWRRVILVGAALAEFGLLFPVAAVRGFCALNLPRGQLGAILLIAALGVAALTAFWKLAGHVNSGGWEQAWTTSGRGVCGVGPADRTGKSLVTYWPGGTRPAGASCRRPRKPREMIGGICPPPVITSSAALGGPQRVHG